LSNLHIPIADYTPKPWFCQTFIAKKPPQKCPENVTKSYKTPGKSLERFGNYGKSLYNYVI
jgi:hypothetical protein